TLVERFRDLVAEVERDRVDLPVEHRLHPGELAGAVKGDAGEAERDVVVPLLDRVDPLETGEPGHLLDQPPLPVGEPLRRVIRFAVDHDLHSTPPRPRPSLEISLSRSLSTAWNVSSRFSSTA